MSKTPNKITDTNTDKPNYTKTLTTLAHKFGADLALECLNHLNALGKSFDIGPEDKELKLSGDDMTESSEES